MKTWIALDLYLAATRVYSRINPLQSNQGKIYNIILTCLGQESVAVFIINSVKVSHVAFNCLRNRHYDDSLLATRCMWSSNTLLENSETFENIQLFPADIHDTKHTDAQQTFQAQTVHLRKPLTRQFLFPISETVLQSNTFYKYTQRTIKNVAVYFWLQLWLILTDFYSFYIGLIMKKFYMRL